MTHPLYETGEQYLARVNAQRERDLAAITNFVLYGERFISLKSQTLIYLAMSVKPA
jgi:hypothetical protein